VNNFNNYNNIILLNINLRFENALLNAKLRQKIIWAKKVNVFFIGAKYNLTYKYIQLGTTTKIFLKLLEGRHYLFNFLKKERKTLIFYNTDIIDLYKHTGIFSIFYNLKVINKTIDINFLAKGSSTVFNFDLSLTRSVVKFSDSFKNKKQLIVNFYLKCNKFLPLNVLEKKILLHNLNISFDSYGDNYLNFVKFLFPLVGVMEVVRTTYYINCYGIIKEYTKLKNKFKNILQEEEKYRKFSLHDFKNDLDVFESVFDICLMRSKENQLFSHNLNYERIIDFLPFFELFKCRIIFYNLFEKKIYKAFFYFLILTSKYKNPFNKTLLLSHSSNLSTLNISFFKKKNNFLN